MRGYWLSNIWTKCTTWEYWPAWFFNIPVFFMYIIQGIRNSNFLFFSRVNPDIITGGFFSEEKWPIYQMFPDKYIPLGTLIDPNMSTDEVQDSVQSHGLIFPLLVKPNIGERGMGIEKIYDISTLMAYHAYAGFTYIIQEYVPFSQEMSVLAYRRPEDSAIEVTSVCLKEKLSIHGDGHSSLEALALDNYRSRIQWARLAHHFDPKHILPRGEKMILEPIGNHCRGTTFLNGNHLIDPRFIKLISRLFNSIRGEIHYGRFDIIYNNIDDLIACKNFKIVEFNGVGSEPAHIYQPGFPLMKAYKCMWEHVKILGDIGLSQKSRGVPAMTWNSFVRALKLYRSNLRLVNGGNEE